MTFQLESILFIRVDFHCCFFTFCSFSFVPILFRCYFFCLFVYAQYFLCLPNQKQKTKIKKIIALLSISFYPSSFASSALLFVFLFTIKMFQLTTSVSIQNFTLTTILNSSNVYCIIIFIRKCLLMTKNISF